jgi:hypothetical protein
VNEQLRLASWIIIAFGIVLTLASLFADPLGIGEPGSSFGWKQITGTIVGLLIAGAGFLWTRRLDRQIEA